MPPGPQPDRDPLVRAPSGERAYDLIRDEVDEGRQAFVICPLVEESEASDVESGDRRGRAAANTTSSPICGVALLHGRMKPAEKDAVMTRLPRPAIRHPGLDHR